MGIFSPFFDFFAWIWDGFMAIMEIILLQPLLNSLVWLYDELPGKNMLLAITVFTLFTRIIIWPLTRKARKYQEEMQKVQPELEKIRQKYADDKEKLYQETMKVYATKNVNPVAGCLPILVQFVISIGIFTVMKDGLTPDKIDDVNEMLYFFVEPVSHFNTEYFWLDLTEKDPYLVLPALLLVVQFIQTRVMMSKTVGAASETMRQTAMFMPLFLFFVFIGMPAGLTYYVLLTSAFGVVEQYFLKSPKMGGEISSTTEGEGEIIEGEVVDNTNNESSQYLPTSKSKKKKKKKK